jgi:hypothetical protein
LNRRTALLLSLAVLGLFLYLWPALRAPVVLWSDSEIDLKWAREGVGLWTPLTKEEGRVLHPLKPGYILYLRLASRTIPKVGEERSAVIVQSVLLWLSIAATSLALGRRRDAETGIALYVALILFLPLRNSASAVMSEAISAALLLPLIAVAAIGPPRTPKGIGALALGLAMLVSIRPNVGAIGFLVAATLYLVRTEFRHGLILVTFFSGLVLAGWLIQRPLAGGRTAAGAADALVFGSAQYYWRPEIGDWPEASEKSFFRDPRTRRAIENWRKTIARSGPDARREIAWRAFHGLFGQEFYDTRWSRSYATVDVTWRIAAPLLVLAACALLLMASLRGPERATGLAGLLLLVLLVAQNLALGSHPRFVLPFLPVLLLLGALVARPLTRASVPRRVMAAAAFLLLLGVTAANASVLDWQWGKIESAGVRIRQRIPKGALPAEEPATLHVRIASPVVPSPAHFMVLGPEKTVLYTSENDADRRAPAITAPLPQALLDANAAGAVEIEVVTFGFFGEFQYLLFPVIPPPWRARAFRKGSDALSPSTGIRSGALDWWAHSGFP